MPPSISPSRTPLPRRRCKQKRERSPAFSRNFAKTARASARAVFVCRIDAGERGGRTLSVSLCSTARSPFCRLAGEVAFGTNPLSRLRRQPFPFLSPGGDIFPRPGEVFRRESPWQRGQVSSSPVNGRKKPAVKQQTFRLCQSLSLSGEVARRSRDGEGRFRDEPSQSPTATALPKGEPLAKRATLVLIGQLLEEANL